MSSTYKIITKPWAIFKLSLNQKWEFVERYRNFNHASKIAKMLSLLNAGTQHKVVWDVPKPDQTKPAGPIEKVPVK